MILSPSNTILSGIAKPQRFPSIILDGNTVGWYIAGDLTTITKDGSDFVSRWNDKLGSGHDLIQATGADQPKWFSVNGILFPGVQEFMKTAAFTFNQPEMIYIVFKQITWTSLDRFFDGEVAVSGTFYQVTSSPNVSVFAGTGATLNGSFAINTFSIIRILINGASSKLIINNETPITGELGATNMEGFTLGSQGGGITRFSNIQVKEIILRKVADATQNETAIYNYLSKKYGI